MTVWTSSLMKNSLLPSHMEMEDVHVIRKTQVRDPARWSWEKMVELNIQRMKSLRVSVT